MRWFILLAGLVIAGCAGQQTASFQPGMTVASPLRIGGKSVPLPDGDWVVAATERGYEQMATEMVNVFLLNTRPNAEILAVQASTNLGAYVGGWKQLATCERRDMLFAQPNDGYSHERQACWFVNHVAVSGRTKIVADTLDFIRKRGMSFPAVSPYVGMRVADQTDYLTARFYFDPRVANLTDPRGLIRVASAWRADRIEQTPPLRAYADRVIGWGREWFPKVQTGFFGRAAQ